MIWFVAIGLGLLVLWLWRVRRDRGPEEQGDFAKWKRDLADKERAQRKAQPPTKPDRPRSHSERHY